MGSLNLPSSGTVYLDANGFIYSVERVEPYHGLLLELWENAQAQRITVISSELVRLETLIKPLRTGDEVLVNLFHTIFGARELKLIPATAEVWDHAAQLRATYPSLKTPDALHAATALAERCAMFLTNDSSFLQIAELPVTLLSDCLH